MTMDRWNAWLQVLASLGLIAGLVLVGVEIQQTRDLARIELRLEGILVFQEVEIAMLGENPAEAWAKSILAPESLSPTELKILDSYLVHAVNQWRRTLFLETEGLLEVGATQRTVHGNAWFYFGNAFAKQWWRTMLDHPGGWEPDFLRMVDAEVDALDDRRNARWIEELTSTADR